MPADANAVLQASVTKTASFNSTSFDMGVAGTKTAELMARVIYSAASNASGSNTVTFTLEHSDDNSTFYTISSAAADVITLSTTAQAGEIFLPIEYTKRYIRLVQTLAGAGTSPTITYQGDIVKARP